MKKNNEKEIRRRIKIMKNNEKQKRMKKIKITKQCKKK